MLLRHKVKILLLNYHYFIHGGPDRYFFNIKNEWGEGNYIEPDEKYGNQYIDVLRRNLIG